MHALASILAKPLSGNTSDRLMSRQRLDEVCAVLRKASEGYSSTERTLAAVNIIREWFAEAGMAHGSEMALSGAAGEDAAAELLLSVAVIDTLGPVFEQRFQGVTAATSVKAAEAEQHLILRGVAVLGEFEALRAQVAELFGGCGLGMPAGITQRIQIAAGAIAAAELFASVSGYAAALQARSSVLLEFGTELEKALGILQRVFSDVRQATPGALKAEKITEFIGVS